jgi:hypothetical protein
VLACQDFYKARADARGGILTAAEMRTRLQAVHERAQYSDDPQIRDSARGLLAAATSGAPAAGFVDQLTSACGAHLAER